MNILKQLLEENKQTLSKNDYNNISRMLREYETNNNINEEEDIQESNKLRNILVDLLEEKKELTTDQIYIDSYNILSKLHFSHVRKIINQSIWTRIVSYCYSYFNTTCTQHTYIDYNGKRWKQIPYHDSDLIKLIAYGGSFYESYGINENNIRCYRRID